jgi:transcriptional regulator with XRE-family HTH domain
MDREDLSVGEHLKEIRQNRGLTLEDAANLTGVRKPMLGQIERGRSSPTVNTLWKISTGLKVPLSAFLKREAAEYEIADGSDNGLIQESGGKMRAWPVFAFDPVRSVEIFRIEFDPGCVHDSQKHLDGVEEYVLVEQGNLDLVLGGRTVSLGPGQAIRFRADVPHSYRNPYESLCKVTNLIFYPVK